MRLDGARIPYWIVYLLSGGLLAGAHRLLDRQKDALLKESVHNKDVLIGQLFAHLKQGKMKDAGAVRDSLSALVLAQAEIEKASTWPRASRSRCTRRRAGCSSPRACR